MSQGEESDAGVSGGGWLSGWLNSAKEKSVSALNMVKRDLAEFTTVMHEDTAKVAASMKEKLTQENATAATQKMKQGVTTLLGGISKALVVEPDDNYQMAKIIGGEAVIFDRFKVRLHELQIDPTTYTSNPTSEERYQEWLSTFDLEGSKGAISELLVSNVEVRALYTQLVPLTVSNNDFWRRYYFRCHVLEEEEARRVELMKRAENVHGENEKEIGWEDEDDDDVTTEMPATNTTEAATKGRLDDDDDDVVSKKEVEPSDGTAAGDIESRAAINPSQHSDFSSPTSESSVTVSSGSMASCGSGGEDEDIGSRLGALTGTESNTEDTGAAEVAASFLNVNASETAKCVASDRASVVSSRLSDQSAWSAVSSNDAAKSDSLIIVAATPDRTSPSDEGSNAKESLDEDWEKDFDVEVTEQDLQAAKDRLKNLSTATQSSRTDEKPSEDWEDW